jgi:hypothetical protein
MLVAVRKRIWLVAATIVATLGLVAFAQAAIPGADGVINGCYNKTTGNLRVVDSGSPCTNAESALSWNQAGTQGQPGPQGPQGPSGSSHAYHDRGSSLLPSDGSANLAGVHNLPAGNYVVMVSVSVYQADTYPMVCSLREADGTYIVAPVGYTGWPEASGGRTTTAMVTTLNRPAGSSIVVSCSTAPEASNASAEIVAMKVDALN